MFIQRSARISRARKGSQSYTDEKGRGKVVPIDNLYIAYLENSKECTRKLELINEPYSKVTERKHTQISCVCLCIYNLVICGQ